MMLTTWRWRRSRSLARQADSAMQGARWEDAARLYARAFQMRPERIDFKVQQAHALKEMGNMAAAVQVYGQASSKDDDGLLHLALLHEQLGHHAEAIVALGHLLDRSPDHADGLNALLSLGMGAHLPLGLRERLRAFHRDGMLDHVVELEQALSRAKALMEERVEAYDAIRPIMTFAPPALDGSLPLLCIIVDARDTQPSFLRATLDSLQLSSHQRWLAFIVAPDTLREHPVASMADMDERLQFIGDGDAITVAECLSDVHLSSGIQLDPHALTWISHVFRTTSAVACMSDWDHCMTQWDTPDHYFDPQLLGAFDLDWLLSTDFPPPLAAVRAGVSKRRALDPSGRRAMLATIATVADNRVAHIGLPLATVTRMPDRAARAPARQTADGKATPLWSLEPQGFPPSPGQVDGCDLMVTARPGRPFLTCGVASERSLIRVIIPTRDLADLLERMVDSLFARAAHPECIRVTILDNRSQEEASHTYFRRLAVKAEIDIQPYDAPFNWSRMNNMGATACSEPILVFANNDMEMLSDDWDLRLSGQLSRGDVGVIGARLLYPDGQLQHGGMLMGLADGSPVHEGVFAAADDAVSDPRFDHVRAVSAVTGAFMGVRRAHFEALGGFDAENFSIAYNDVDFCLASRAAGRKVLYDPGIELTHFESRTRGFNDSRSKIAWDQGELRALHRKWGAALQVNPGLSPWWTATRPYRSLAPHPAGFDPVILPSNW